ncbi:MAPEG family protein [Acidisphaera sp. L21]|uniref:MAPEG family protein n=1 Tax=Acidisphaera sp. L21 TaxID=1641851 RepID=UPI00131A76B7|nr:MAPEG family protein [Acidisphaera sp. L21]
MRGVSLLLGSCGVVAAALLWRHLAGQIAVFPGAASIAVRLGLGLAFLLPSAILVWLMLLVQMAARMVTGALDPAAGGDGPFLRTNQRIIGNSVEHGIVFGAGLLALVAGVDAPHMPAIAALCIVFTVCRVTFWAGYLVTPVGRTIGMAPTMAITGVTLGWALMVWAKAAGLV